MDIWKSRAAGRLFPRLRKYLFVSSLAILNEQLIDFMKIVQAFIIITFLFACSKTKPATGSLKYVNYSADTISYTWLIAGNSVVPDLTFLDIITPGDSLSFRYQPAGVYKTQISQIGGPY